MEHERENRRPAPQRRLATGCVLAAETGEDRLARHGSRRPPTITKFLRFLMSRGKRARLFSASWRLPAPRSRRDRRATRRRLDDRARARRVVTRIGRPCRRSVEMAEADEDELLYDDVDDDEVVAAPDPAPTEAPRPRRRPNPPPPPGPMPRLRTRPLPRPKIPRPTPRGPSILTSQPACT